MKPFAKLRAALALANLAFFPALAAEKTRPDILAEMGKVKEDFLNSRDNVDVRYEYTNLLFQSGDFWEARKVAQPIVEAPDATNEALTLAARLAYLVGKYEIAEDLFQRILDTKAGDPNERVLEMVGLMFAYYQQNKYDKIRAMEFPSGVQLPNVEAIKASAKLPYQIEWANEDRVASMPFLVPDPLPVFMVEVNGVPMAVAFDTGADSLILDNEVAAALGIEEVVNIMADGFGGGKPGEIGFGWAESLSIGEVTMKNIPINILPIKQFSDHLGSSGIVLGGIIGTAMMRQFVGTLDYENERIVLRERTPESVRKLKAVLDVENTVTIPFVLDLSHLMMARGSLNGKTGLTFFVDSGLGSQDASIAFPGFSAPIQTLNYLGIPEPVTTLNVESSGGAGGAWASGRFIVESIGLGPLVQSDVVGEYGARIPTTYWQFGYIQDALISHGFLGKYSSWSIDFDNMMYIFER
ncbi:MAG: hypothetical protein GXP16_00800 [Gammaproteobacteria bacterium]|nr:hypothetical protein [Gammaproteobacteria bacterium]